MGTTIVFDLKTARSAAPEDFARDIARYNYASQAAFYLDGLATLSNVRRRWVWIVLEKEPPYLSAVYEPDERLIAQGRLTYRRWLEIYCDCKAKDVWPGYPSGINSIDVPRWAQGDLVGVINGESF
jgi:hypothetical protein